VTSGDNGPSIGLVGVGIMGTAYARNLRARGFAVSGWDVDPDRLEVLRRLGGSPGASIAEVAAGSDVVLSALPSTAALTEAVEGPQGVLAGAHAGLVFVEMSTFPLAAKERAKAVLEAAGVAVIDAPVSGTGAQAADADIVIYASGEAAAIAQASPVFDAIAKASHDLGEFGNGSKMKYVANLLVSVHNLATAEAFVLGMKAGLEPQQMLDVITAGAGNSKILELRGPMMVADDYQDASARLKMFIKDISVIGEYAGEVGVPTPLLDASLPLYEEGVAMGLGDLDAAALCRLLEKKAGFDR
jgi:3-hydroxyisobutyrate dehydrogenase-like beta-hydroxyacid dehydrogenase